MPYPIRTRTRTRLTVQQLEDRRTPTVIAWDGGAGTNNWLDALNWAGDALPGATDDVSITTGGGVTLSGTASVASVTCTTPFTLSGGSLDVSGSALFSGAFNQTGGTLQGSGTVTFNGPWTWTGGAVAGVGALVLSAGATGQIDTTTTAVKLTDRAVDIAGNLNWIGNLSLQTGDGKLTIVNGGTFDVRGDGSWEFGAGAGAMPITVATGGTLRRSTGVATVIVEGLVTNNGTINVAAGSLQLDGGLSNFAGTKLAGGRLVLAGTLKVPGINVVTNQSEITLDGASSGLATPAGGNGLANLTDNSGALTLLNGAVLTTAGGLATNGALTVGTGSTLATAAGDITQVGSSLVNGVLDPAGKLTISSGILTGTGLVASDVTHDGGAVQPAGFAVGALTIAGNYTSSFGLLSVQVGGPVAGVSYDQLEVQGTVNLAGFLGVGMGYKAPLPSSFTIINNSGTSDPTVGAFVDAPENGILSLSGLRFRINYNAGDGNDVVLTRLPSLVDGVSVNEGAAQRSMVRSVSVTFQGKVTLPANPADAFTLQRTGPGGTGFAAFTVSTAGSTPTQTVAKLTFSGALSENSSLVDGRYTLSIIGGQILDIGGATIDADGDGNPGGIGTANLHRLFGDNDGDGDVDAGDFGAFRSAFGTANTVFDFDNDGDVDAGDFGQFRQRFGLSV